MKNEEAQIQEAIVDFFDIKKVLIFSVPNGANMSNPATRALFHATGLRSGVSDLIAVFSGDVAFIEVKTRTGRQSDTQKEFEKQVKSRGFDYIVMRSVSDAVAYLDDRKRAGKPTR